LAFRSMYLTFPIWFQIHGGGNIMFRIF